MSIHSLGLESREHLVSILETDPGIFDDVLSPSVLSEIKTFAGPAKTYIKFLRSDHTHHGLTYKVGLNIDPLPFVGSGACQAGGIYFTEFNWMGKWTHYGTRFAIVKIPDDARVYKEPCGTKLKADKIEIVDIVDMEGNPHWMQTLLDNDPVKILEVVTSCGKALKYVTDQTLEICLAAVTNYGFSLMYVKEQTPELCLAAVTSHGWALDFVKDQTPELCLAAVISDGLALENVINQTPEICLAAVTEYGGALQFVKDQTPEICLAAVTTNGGALEFVNDQTPGFCLAAVMQYGNSLLYVKEQTPEICQAAVKQSKTAERYVKINYV